MKPAEYLSQLVASGAGELFLNIVDRDGTLEGYDLKSMKPLLDGVEVAVIGCGGGKSLEDMAQLLRLGFDAASAGAMFVYHGPHRAVLINYPKRDAIETIIHEKSL